eukprot:782800-Pelagomonas_calceolata.AAC.1
MHFPKSTFSVIKVSGRSLRASCGMRSPEQVAFSFNGGKDSTVLLQLLLTAVGGNKGEFEMI